MELSIDQVQALSISSNHFASLFCHPTRYIMLKVITYSFIYDRYKQKPMQVINKNFDNNRYLHFHDS
ncbi:hypothetical protein Hanom_Chr14g01296201 [Helianthus anomalus]